MGVLILDVETISFDYNCISDIAWGIAERNKLITSKNFIVQEHLAKMSEGNFSKPKMEKTMQEVVDGRATIAPYSVIMQELQKDFNNAKYCYAYNANFDRNAIIKTCKALQQTAISDFFESTANFDKWRDLWAWASNTILYKKSFIDFCEANELMTEKGFCSTSAETTLKFLKKDLEYVESHTALDDIQDEFLIYLAIKKEINREFNEICLDDSDYRASFKGKPFFTIAKLKKAINQ